MKKLLLIVIAFASILIYCGYRIQKSNEDYEKPSPVVEEAIRRSNERKDEYQQRQLQALLLLCVREGYITEKKAKALVRKINDDDDRLALINMLDSTYASHNPKADTKPDKTKEKIR